MVQSAFAARKAANINADRQKDSKPPGLALVATNTDTPEYIAQIKERPARKKRRKLDEGYTRIVKTVEISQDLAVHSGTSQKQHDRPAESPAVTKQEISEIHGTNRRFTSPGPDLKLSLASLGFKISNDLSWNDAYTIVDINLKLGEAVLIIGEYDIWVKKGSIQVFGARIHASARSLRFYCPITHAIPAIEALPNPFGPSSQDVEIQVSSCASGLRRLQRCDPKFLGAWQGIQEKAASFEFLDSNEPITATPFRPPHDWQTQASNLLNSESIPIVMICGPKNAGKSTFARFLSNSLLSWKYSETGLAYLDLDPGQPEYSSPADLTLSSIKTLNFGPPFVHPIFFPEQSSQTIRQHHFGHLSPRADLEYYLSCAVDLHRHYEMSLKLFGQPLIINTCGWIQGLGLDLLISLAEKIRPSHVLLFASPELEEIRKSIEQFQAELHTLSTNPFSSGTKSGADLRSMQHGSYFHAEDIENEQLHWKSEPLLKSASLSLAYSGNHKIISGILLLGNHINYEILEDAVDKTVLALVALEDLPSVSNILKMAQEEFSEEGITMNGDVIYAEDEIDEETVNEEPFAERYAEESSSLGGGYVLKHNSRGLPFLCTTGASNPPLNPSKTRSLGQVLLSGIDHPQGVLQVHTPISSSAIQACIDDGTPLILVRGQTGMPEWAYLEEYNQAKATKEDMAALKSFGQNDIPDGDLEFDPVAWAKSTSYVEYQDTQGPRSGGKVRRVRRNLV